MSNWIVRPLWHGPEDAVFAGLCFVVPVATGQRDWGKKGRMADAYTSVLHRITSVFLFVE